MCLNGSETLGQEIIILSDGWGRGRTPVLLADCQHPSLHTENGRWGWLEVWERGHPSENP